MGIKLPNSLRTAKAKKLGLALVVATGLTATIALTRAATSFYSVEPENSTISGSAAIKTDTGASGGKYITFGATSSSTNTGGSTTTTPTPSTPSAGSTGIKGTAYYVSCNGNDSADGKTEATAWASLSKASSASLSAGDGILFKRGCSWSGNLTVKWSGTSASPVVIGAYSTGNAPILSRNTNGAVVSVTGAYSVVQDLTITASAPSKDSTGGKCNGSPIGNVQGISFESGSANNTVKNSVISNMYAGVYLKSGAHDNHVLNNDLKDNNMMSPLDTSADNDAGAFGVLIWGNNNEIAYNTISGSNACSYDYVLDGSAVEIFGGSSTPTSNNRIHHNKAINTNAFTELGKSSSGAIPDNNTFVYNSYYTNGISNAIFMVTRGGSGSYGPINGTKAYNNTAYMVGTGKNGLYCGSCSASALVFKNNIIATTNSTPIPSGLGTGVSNNLGWVIGNPSGDPKFVNGAGQDFHLSSGSPAVNAGTNEITTLGFSKDLDNKTIPAGGTVDIGAYEFGAVATKTGSSSRIATIIKSRLSNIGTILGNVAHNVTKVFKNLGSIFSKNLKTPKVEALQADGSINIAAVGDMNGSGNTSTSSGSGKNASAITTGLNNNSLDAFISLGDYQYGHGDCGTGNGTDLAKNWGALWGGTISKIYTTAGQTHDVNSTSDTAYEKFFSGQCAGSTAKSAAVVMANSGNPLGAFEFYSFDIGKWHFAQLPSAAWNLNPAKANEATIKLDADLAKAKSNGQYLAVFFHNPYFTSSSKDAGGGSGHTRDTNEKPWIDIIDKYDVRFMLNGHQHNYERSCPVQANDTCTADNGTGTTAFNVSTGGIGYRTFADSPSYIVKRFYDTYGWLKMTLNTDGSFSWAFNPVSNATGTTLNSDSGSRPAVGGTSTTPPPTPTPVPTTDTTKPTVSISSPANNATVSNTVQLSASASDNSGSIKKVELMIDNATTANQTLTTSPYTFSIDSRGLTNGAHTLTVKATDPSGNSNSASITVNVSNAACQSVGTNYGSLSSTVSIASSGKYRVWSRMRAPDSINNSYYLVVDSQCPVNIGDKAIASGAWTWVDSRDGQATTVDLDLTAGNHTIKLIGREPNVDLDRVIFVADLNCVPNGFGDNCSSSTDTMAPMVTIDNPTANQTIKGSVPISVTAKDNVNVNRVEYYLDSDATVPFATSSTSPFGVNWDSSNAPAGSHLLRAIAIDSAGNKSAEATVQIKIADQIKPTVSITSPASGAISGSKEISIAATDNVGVSKVELKMDNQTTLATLSSAPYYYVWDTKSMQDGNHSLVAYATDAEGNVGVSQAVNISITNDVSLPTTPSGLKATNITSTSVDLTWNASTDNKNVVAYGVYNGNTFIEDVAVPKYTDTSLTPSTTYTYYVTAKDSSGNESAPSAVLTVKTASTTSTPPSAPDNLTVSSSSPTQISLSWAAVNGASKYLIQRDGQIIDETTSTSYQDKTVLPGQTYVYAVYAVNSDGSTSLASGFKTIQTQQVTDTQAPSAPVGLSGIASANMINLSWYAAHDNVGVANYQIYRDDKKIDTTKTLSYGDGTVVAGREYSYYVVAVDANGNVSDKSNIVKLKAQDEGSNKTKFSVTADSYVQKNKSKENFGSKSSINVDKSPNQKMLMKFTISGTSGKVITSAKIRLYANNGSTRTGGLVYGLKSNAWQEDSVNWNNAPEFDSNLLYKLGRVAKNSYVDVDVSDYIRGDGTYSIGFSSTSTDGAHYNSKESGSKGPELIITTN